MILNRSYPERNNSHGGNFRNSYALNESPTGWYSIFVSFYLHLILFVMLFSYCFDFLRYQMLMIAMKF